MRVRIRVRARARVRVRVRVRVRPPSSLERGTACLASSGKLSAYQCGA